MNSFYNIDSWQKTNFAMPYQWDYDAAGSPRAMVSHYNDVSCDLTLVLSQSNTLDSCWNEPQTSTRHWTTMAETQPRQGPTGHIDHHQSEESQQVPA